jgi:hypothetical protein
MSQKTGAAQAKFFRVNGRRQGMVRPDGTKSRDSSCAPIAGTTKILFKLAIFVAALYRGGHVDMLEGTRPGSCLQYDFML